MLLKSVINFQTTINLPTLTIISIMGTGRSSLLYSHVGRYCLISSGRSNERITKGTRERWMLVSVKPVNECSHDHWSSRKKSSINKITAFAQDIPEIKIRLSGIIILNICKEFSNGRIFFKLENYENSSY